MKKYLLLGLVYPVAFVAGALAQEIPTGPLDQVSTTNEITRAVKKDPWEPDRYNYIDPRTGLRTGGFIKRDVWEPKRRWNIYDAKGRNTGKIEEDQWESDRLNVTDYDAGVEAYDDGIGEYDDGTGGE